MYTRALTVLLALVFIISTADASQKRKVLFIGIDGTRSDALQQANTPNLDSLFAAPGLSTYNAWCCGITISGPTWSSMMTGVWFDKHGVTNNSYSNSNFDTYPYFTKLAKQIKPNLYCAEVCEWPPLIDDVPTADAAFDLALHTPDGQSATTASTASTILASNDSIDFFFVYFDHVDLTGHGIGFDPTLPAYITAIETVDTAVGVVINALHNRPNYANEDWDIIVMTDHGGINKGHGGNTNEERHIWWIADGKDFQHVTPSGVDPGTYNYYIIGAWDTTHINDSVLRQTPVHTDVAVTALHHLIYDSGINPMNQTDWQLDGKSWLIDYTSAITPVNPAIELKIFPNPATNTIVIYYNNDEKQTASAKLYDIQGHQTGHNANYITANKMSMEVSGLAAGAYEVRVQVGNNVTSQTLVVK